MAVDTSEALGFHSLNHHATAAEPKLHLSACSSGLGSQDNQHLCCAIADINSAVPRIGQKETFKLIGHLHVQFAF